MSVTRITTTLSKDLSQAKPSVDSLPPESLELVLGFLGKIDMMHAASVNRQWNTAVIDTARFKELSSIRSFAKLLLENLSEKLSPEQKEVLLSICNDRKILGSVNLLAIKDSILTVKESLLNILKTKTITLKDLERLKKLSKGKILPSFSEDIFSLAETHKILEQRKIDDGLVDRVRTLMQDDEHIDEAVAVANTIVSEERKWRAFADICVCLKFAGNIDRAIAVANTIDDEGIKGKTLSDISLSLSDVGNTDRAIEVANTIVSEEIRGEAFATISLHLRIAGNIDRAIEVANTITIEWLKEMALANIS